MGDGSYYLLDNRNPHAFGGFWGYTTRRARVRLLVLHTTENRFDTVPPDTGAEAVANYLSNTSRAASYHDIADSDSLVKCLPHSYTAFGAHGHNSHAVHMAFAGQAARWHTLTAGQVDDRLQMLAARARVACAAYDIPVRRLRGTAARVDGARGICGHVDVDPNRRSDPGSGFPWGRFLTLLQGDDMPYTPDELADIVQDAVFKAGFGRGDNVETFGDRVGQIRVDARAARQLLSGLTSAVGRLSAQVDALAEGDVDVAHGCGDQVREALADAGRALAELDGDV